MLLGPVQKKLNAPKEVFLISIKISEVILIFGMLLTLKCQASTIVFDGFKCKIYLNRNASKKNAKLLL
jgi:hypothetical protein